MSRLVFSTPVTDGKHNDTIYIHFLHESALLESIRKIFSLWLWGNRSQKEDMICYLNTFPSPPSVFSSSHVSYPKSRDDISVHFAHTLYRVQEINLTQWEHSSGNPGGGQVCWEHCGNKLLSKQCLSSKELEQMAQVSTPSGEQRAITLRWETEWKLQIFIPAERVSGGCV